MIDLPQEIYDLMLDRLTDSLRAEDAVRLQQWLDVSEAHREAWKEIAMLWYCGKIGSLKEADKTYALAWQMVCEKHARSRKRRVLLRFASVAAVVLLTVGNLLLFFPSSVKRSQVNNLADLVAGQVQSGVTLILSNGKQVELGKGIKYEEQGVNIYSDSSGIIYQEEGQRVQQDSIGYNELIVPVGGEYQLLLSDSSRIVLNADSRLRYPVRFTSACREVWISGEAFLQVAPNPGQPFVVHTGMTDIQVLGTEFNVAAYENESVTEITLVRGKVRVKVDGKQEDLNPGYQVKVDRVTMQVENKKVDVYPYVAWKDGLLLFDDISLEQLMLRLSRWYNIHFEFRQEELKWKKFTGGFKRYEGIEKILEMIGNVNDVDFCVENGKVVMDWKR